MPADNGGQVLNQTQTCCIFLRRDNEAFVALHSSECLLYCLKVVVRELVVVSKGQRRDVTGDTFQVHHHLHGQGNAGEQQHMGVCRQFFGLPGRVGEEAIGLAVVEGGEEQLLVRLQRQRFPYDSVVHWGHLGWALADDDDVRAFLGDDGFAQAPCGKHGIICDETMVICEQDVQPCLHIAVLEGIVKENDIDILGLGIRQKTVDAVTAVSIHGHDGIGKLLFDLPGLVSYLVHR